MLWGLSITYEMKTFDLALMVLFVLCSVFLFVWFMDVVFWSPAEKAGGLKLDNCVNLANQYGLDPNDEMRFTFIENCYND